MGTWAPPPVAGRGRGRIARGLSEAAEALLDMGVLPSDSRDKVGCLKVAVVWYRPGMMLLDWGLGLAIGVCEVPVLPTCSVHSHACWGKTPGCRRAQRQRETMGCVVCQLSDAPASCIIPACMLRQCALVQEGTEAEGDDGDESTPASPSSAGAFRPGRVVWAKVEGHDWWPARIVRRRAVPKEVSWLAAWLSWCG